MINRRSTVVKFQYLLSEPRFLYLPNWFNQLSLQISNHVLSPVKSDVPNAKDWESDRVEYVGIF